MQIVAKRMRQAEKILQWVTLLSLNNRVSHMKLLNYATTGKEYNFNKILHLEWNT